MRTLRELAPMLAWFAGAAYGWYMRGRVQQQRLKVNAHNESDD